MIKMKKLFALTLLCSIVFIIACADSKTFVDEKGRSLTVEPYGIFTTDDKIDSVHYEVNAGNVVWSIVLAETIFVPVWLVGWEIYEPKTMINTKLKWEEQ